MTEREPSKQGLEMTHDYQHHYRGIWSDGGVCRIRIFQRAGRTPVVIASELDENTNSSITNMAEYIAAEVIRDRFPDRFEEDAPVHWLEHYPPIEVHGRWGRGQQYDPVTFETYAPRIVWLGGVQRIALGAPTWRHLPAEELLRLTDGTEPQEETR